MTIPADQDPGQLTRPESELLDDIRRAMSPAPADENRVRNALLASLAAGAVGPTFPIEIRRPLQDLGAGLLTQGLRGLGKQLIAAGFVGAAGFGAGFLAGRIDSTARPLPATTAAIAPSVSVQVQPTETKSFDASLGMQAPMAVSEPTARAAKNATSEPSPSGSVTDVRLLNEEADALRRVGHALREGRLDLAQQLLDDLDANIPRSALGEERAAARLMLRCQSGEGLARPAARLWLKHHVRSMYAPRVKGSCNLADEADGRAEK